jgi:transcriptional regulator with XRE-family HTH domain
MDNETILLTVMRNMMWTREDLAERLGVSRRTVTRYIHGGTPDRIAFAVQWLYYLETKKVLGENYGSINRSL